MKTRQINLFLTFFLGIILLASARGWAVSNFASPGPIITHSFGPEVGKYGDPLKFYIEADDPAADMQKIAIVVDQTGSIFHRETDIILWGIFNGILSATMHQKCQNGHS